MVPFHGKPFMGYTVDMLREQGFESVLMLLGYLPEVVMDHFGEGSDYGVEIDYDVLSADDLTAYRIQHAADRIDDTFLLLYCDNYWPMRFDDLWSSWVESGAPAQITVYSNRDGYTRDSVIVGENGFVDVRVRVDLLHVVEVVEHVHQLQELFRVLARDCDLVLRDPGQLCGGELDSGFLQPVLHGHEVGDLRSDDELFAVTGHVLCPGLDRGLEDLVLAVLARDDDELPLPVELPGHGAVGAQAAPVLRQGVPDVGHGAVRVVGQTLDEEGHPARAVAFVRRFDVVDALELAGALLDRPLDVLLRHRVLLRRIHGESQAGVEFDATPALLRGHGDLADQLGKERSALGVIDALLALDLRPFVVASHMSSGGAATGLGLGKYRGVRPPINPAGSIAVTNLFLSAV